MGTISVAFLDGDPPVVNFNPGIRERPGRIEYLYLTVKQREAIGAMDAAVDKLPSMVRLRCQTPQVREEDGVDKAYFQHVDYDERTPPSPGEANLMCKTAGKMCPLAAQCLALGLALEADGGVWGGNTLVDGKIYTPK